MRHLSQTGAQKENMIGEELANLVIVDIEMLEVNVSCDPTASK